MRIVLLLLLPVSVLLHSCSKSTGCRDNTANNTTMTADEHCGCCRYDVELKATSLKDTFSLGYATHLDQSSINITDSKVFTESFTLEEGQSASISATLFPADSNEIKLEIRVGGFLDKSETVKTGETKTISYSAPVY